MIKAIETHYNGYSFRSRLEARWAVFFDELNVPYEYEPQGFELSSGRYLPDFYLPELRCWVEIKPTMPEDTYRTTMQDLAAGTDAIGCIVIGQPGDHQCIGFCSDLTDSSGGLSEWERAEWSFCTICSSFFLDMHIGSRDRDLMYGDFGDSYEYCHCSTPVTFPQTLIQAALSKARSARFEHGETPRTPRGRTRP
jgi:hypothetical protein